MGVGATGEEMPTAGDGVAGGGGAPTGVGRGSAEAGSTVFALAGAVNGCVAGGPTRAACARIGGADGISAAGIAVSDALTAGDSRTSAGLALAFTSAASCDRRKSISRSSRSAFERKRSFASRLLFQTARTIVPRTKISKYAIKVCGRNYTSIPVDQPHSRLPAQSANWRIIA
jgi:hypothetical protein